MPHIAIVGTGISGMGIAYLLQRAGYQITVYEKAAGIGGHTRTVTIDYAGKGIPVDTGFIVYNEVNYPNLVGLFRELRVATEKSNMSLAVTMDHGRFEWGASSLNAVFGQRRNLFSPAFYRMIRDVRRFNRKALGAVEKNPALTLGELVSHLKLGEGFRNYYLLPMGGAIWSCPPTRMMEFPAITFVQFFKNHGLLSMSGQHQWYYVCGGSQAYIGKLTENFRDRIRKDCAVTLVRRTGGNVEVTDAAGATEIYDQIVFACHANEALSLLTDATPEEQAVLGAFQYQRNLAYLHRDLTVMPKRKRCWASWVYHANTPKAGNTDAADIGVTYWMNSLQAIDRRYPVFVTLNPAEEIAPGLVFDRHTFEHPVFTGETLQAQKQLPSLQGKNNSWYCGAYTRYGFHEDGLLSAVTVAQSMGVTIPWH